MWQSLSAEASSTSKPVLNGWICLPDTQDAAHLTGKFSCTQALPPHRLSVSPLQRTHQPQRGSAPLGVSKRIRQQVPCLLSAISCICIGQVQDQSGRPSSHREHPGGKRRGLCQGASGGGRRLGFQKEEEDPLREHTDRTDTSENEGLPMSGNPSEQRPSWEVMSYVWVYQI